MSQILKGRPHLNLKNIITLLVERLLLLVARVVLELDNLTVTWLKTQTLKKLKTWLRGAYLIH